MSNKKLPAPIALFTTTLLMLTGLFLSGCIPLNENTIDEGGLPAGVITLERTACFGTCPIYTLTLYSDGRVVYNGDKFVEITGEHEAQIDPLEVRALVDLMLNGGYFDLEDAYTNRTITDAPSALTSLSIDGRAKQIERYLGDESAPYFLNQIETLIDLAANSEQWTGQPVETTQGIYGSVTVRSAEDEVSLPAGALMTVRLEDVSLADAPSVVVSERVYTEVPLLPAFYDLAFDLLAIEPNAVYSISAEVIDADGNLLYINDALHAALTHGAGSQVDVELIPVEQTTGDIGDSVPSELEGTGWKLWAYSLVDEWVEIPEDIEITLNFADGQVNGSAGCNTYFGTYLANGTSLTIGRVGSTLMACIDDSMQQEAAFLEALETVHSYEWEENILTVHYGDGVSLVFNPHQPTD